MEDILSLDDEVLQDTYIYHLPPDPEVIRLPPLLWKRVEYDIREYVVERQSGGKKVVTWYHRQFLEATNERYLTEDVRKQFHQVLAEYFQGIWSDKCKPLLLTKGKRGNYPVAMRQVPEQPIRFGKNLYNSRKLSELPYQLLHSDQFQRSLADLFTNPEWLYAKCCTMTLTSLIEDFRLAETRCAENISRKRMELEAVQKTGKKEDPNQVAMLRIDEEVFEAIKLVTRMVLLAADNARKDPVNLPVMLLSQLGPDYRGSVYIEKLMQRCEQWCEECSVPLLVPTRECMMKPGGYLLYTIHADVIITGEERDKQYQGAFLREDTMQLYTVQQRSARPDQICVFDLHDNGSCITTDDVGLYIRSIKFVGSNRYLLLDVYTRKDPYEPESEERLYESSTASPVVFDTKPNLFAVSSTGRLIASSAGNIVTLYKRDKHSRLQSFYTSNLHKHKITALIISPDETLLVTTDIKNALFGGNKDETSFVHDLKTKQKLHDIDASINVNKWSLVTKKNILLTRKTGYKNGGTLAVYDLVAGKILHEVVVSDTYTLEMLQLHSSEENVFVFFKDTGITNGVRKYAELVNISSGKKYGKSPEDYRGPYAGGQVFGSDSVYYAVCYWNKRELAIFFAGHVNTPLQEAVLIHNLIGHNQPIKEVVVPASLDMMLTVSQDNTIKVWDLKSILGHFHQELSRIELQMAKNSPNHMLSHIGDTGQMFDLSDVVTQYKPVDAGDKPETTRLAFNRFGDSLYVGTDNGSLQLYDVDTAELKITSDLDVGPVQLMQLSKNGRYIISAGNKKIHVEDLQSQKQLVLEARGKVSCMAESNNILVAGSAGMEAKGRVWNIETGEVVKDFELLYSFYCVAINSTGTQVVSSMFDFPIIVNLVDEEGGPFVDPNKMDTMMSGGICCEISPDDKMAAMSSGDGAVRVITMEGKYIFRLQQKSSAVSLAFVPDSTAILSAGYRSIYVWSLLVGSCKYKLTRHMDFVNGIKFDDSGRYVVTISRDKQLILWDFQRVVSIATFQANCQINAVVISSKTGTIAYIPEGISDVAILKPNQALRNRMAGNVKALPLTPQAQAVALTFSGQRVNEGPTSQSCSVM